MEDLNNETIQLLMSDRCTEDFWLFQLGKSQVPISMDSDHQFMNSFFDNGQKLWAFYQEKLKDFLCDRALCEPKDFIKDITDGTSKEIITAIVTGLCSTYSISLSVAIPLCALVLKKGIGAFCNV